MPVGTVETNYPRGRIQPSFPNVVTERSQREYANYKSKEIPQQHDFRTPMQRAFSGGGRNLTFYLNRENRKRMLSNKKCQPVSAAGVEVDRSVSGRKDLKLTTRRALYP
jgi:hypothetical protein